MGPDRLFIHVMDSYDVAVVGGGPVGMWLAAELHRGGVRPVVLERRAERPPHSKALTIYPRTVEQFAMRGLADRWLAEGTPVPSSHFALLSNRLDFSFLDTRYAYTLFLPQRRTEELLEEHLGELGVPYLRHHAVTGLRQDGAGVDLDVDSPRGPPAVRAAYVAGCDGAASVVRTAAGIDFTGTPDTWRAILGDIELADPPQAPAVTLNRPGGSLYMVAIGGARYRLAVIDHSTLYDPVDKPPTFAELRASTLRLAGTDFGMREPPGAWLSRVGNAARQADRYRAGRVLLAGDAAHIHYPAGGQGLNLGLQDATNLAWKLAAEIRGWAPPGLLDSYHAERYPVGLDVIDDSLAQCGLIANPTREGIALRDRFNAILGAHASLCRELAARLSGLAIRYPAAGQAADLGGQRIPDLDLRGAPAATIFGLLHPAKFVLLSLGSAIAPAGFADRLDVVTAELAGDHPEWAGVRAMLIRPDGYIAWATQADDPPPLGTWLGNALSRHHQAAGKITRPSQRRGPERPKAVHHLSFGKMPRTVPGTVLGDRRSFTAGGRRCRRRRRGWR
ncbi:MAG: FAD-dependent monooxygenase [Streptosporangiaceae bacterium]|nr:FAD-dependent monooxygenase [Streptosporangiaceae bacterium]